MPAQGIRKHGETSDLFFFFLGCCFPLLLAILGACDTTHSSKEGKMYEGENEMNRTLRMEGNGNKCR